jgi:MATE family multidrug resistance protein
MSTTGLTAQAEGAGNGRESRAHLVRALVVGGAIGSLLLALYPVIHMVALGSFQAAADVEARASGYFGARIWGAPAALMGYAVSGWLLGTGRTRSLLLLQIVLNGVNAVLDVWFAAGLGWGPTGIGAGTAIAEWVALAVGLVLVRNGMRDTNPLFDRRQLLALLAANRDILIRTLALLLCFAWFVNSGAKVGTAALAGNEVLLQFITVAAFVLDAFAFVAEKEIGTALGARDPLRLRHAMRVTSELAFAFGGLLAILFFFGGPPLIGLFVADEEARAVALAFLPYCAVVPLLGVAAWQLDGAFLGATQGKALRTAGVIAMLLYIGTDLVLASRFGNTGVWIAFLTLYVYRAASLGWFWPSLVRAAQQAS